MKMLTPVARGRSVWAFTSSFGGGLVAGDQTQLDLTVGTGASCFLGTQSSTKVYRNPGGRPCSHATHAVVEADSLLVFAPEPVQPFAQSRYAQRQEFRLATGAGLVLLDWLTAGRVARGERWAFGHYQSRNDVFIDGERVLVDSLLLNAAQTAPRMGRFDCLATLLLIGPPLRAAASRLIQGLAGRPVEKQAAQLCSASPVPDGVLLRVAGRQVENVRRELQQHLEFVSDRLGDNPWARKW
jgi:urease accessory protein